MQQASEHWKSTATQWEVDFDTLHRTMLAPIPEPVDTDTGGGGGGPDAGEIWSLIKDLPRGSSPTILEVRVPEQLRQFAQCATDSAPEYTPRGNRYRPSAGGGKMFQLPDGTIVSQGGSVKYGPTLDLKMPDGSSWKLHLNGTRGGDLVVPRSIVEPPFEAPKLPEPLPRPGGGIGGIPQIVEPPHIGGAGIGLPVLPSGPTRYDPQEP